MLYPSFILWFSSLHLHSKIPSLRFDTGLTKFLKLQLHPTLREMSILYTYLDVVKFLASLLGKAYPKESSKFCGSLLGCDHRHNLANSFLSYFFYFIYLHYSCLFLFLYLVICLELVIGGAVKVVHGKLD